VQGPIPVLPGHQALGSKNINFIKIDAEGHEWHILSGLIPIIDQDKPAIYVETREYTYEPVYRLMHDHDYTKVYTYNMYSDCMKGTSKNTDFIENAYERLTVSGSRNSQ